MAKKDREVKNLIDLTSEEKKLQMSLVIANIQKEFGYGASQLLGEAKPQKLKRVHSGSFGINDITGGGYPVGRIIEIYGPESSGKSTIALHAVAEFQKKGYVAYMDNEYAMDLVYAESLGVNVQDLILGQPDTAEDTLRIAEMYIKSGIVSLVVIDSVSAMSTRAELDGEIGDNHIGNLARLLSQTLKRLAGLCMRYGTTMIFINQIREKVGVMFGNPETTSGGRALKFYSSIRMDVRPKEINKSGDQAVSRTSKITCVKNKTSPPYRITEVDIEFGTGISRAGEVLDYGVELGLINKSGNWYNYKDFKVNGREAAKRALNENPELLDELINRILGFLNPVLDDSAEEELTDEQIEVELNEIAEGEEPVEGDAE